jgi:hypothetical protein
LNFMFRIAAVLGSALIYLGVMLLAGKLLSWFLSTFGGLALIPWLGAAFAFAYWWDRRRERALGIPRRIFC